MSGNIYCITEHYLEAFKTIIIVNGEPLPSDSSVTRNGTRTLDPEPRSPYREDIKRPGKPGFGPKYRMGKGIKCCFYLGFKQ